LKRDNSGAWHRRLLNLGYFFLIPAVSAAAPLLALPAITNAYGLNGWASVAVGLSLGAAGNTILEMGWSVVGPQAVARADISERRTIYYRALATKLLAACVVIPAAAVAGYFLAPAYAWESAALAAASSSATLGASWFFVGLNKPITILLTDTFPRVGLLVFSALLISRGASLFVYPTAIAAASIMTWILGSLVLRFSPIPPLRFFLSAPSVIREQIVVIAGRLISTGYTSLPVALVALSAPGAVPAFAAYERVMRMAAAILAGFPNRLQSWLGAKGATSQLKFRLRATILSNSALGVLAGVAFALLSPLAVHVLFVGEIGIDPALAWGSGLALALICVSRGLGLGLIAVRSTTALTLSILFAAIVGIPSLLMFPAMLGAQGAVLAGVLAEATGVGAQGLFLVRKTRSMS
jgi:O-antigen/teichoic acid export membrane protein